MSLDSAQAKQDELRHLRSEMAINRRFVFERPLVIIGSGLAAALTLMTITGYDLLSLPFLGVLLFNLWFTFNRIRSNSRIVSYIQLVHDQEWSYEWLGWESALRRYRIWTIEHKKEYIALRKHRWCSIQYDNTMFYGPIYWFHLIFGIFVSMLLVLQLELDEILSKPEFYSKEFSILSTNFVAIATFVAVATLGLRPKVLLYEIEHTRQIWTRALSDLNRGRGGLSESTTQSPQGDAEVQSCPDAPRS